MASGAIRQLGTVHSIGLLLMAAGAVLVHGLHVTDGPGKVF